MVHRVLHQTLQNFSAAIEAVIAHLSTMDLVEFMKAALGKPGQISTNFIGISFEINLLRMEAIITIK